MPPHLGQTLAGLPAIYPAGNRLRVVRVFHLLSRYTLMGGLGVLPLVLSHGHLSKLRVIPEGEGEEFLQVVALFGGESRRVGDLRGGTDAAD